MRRFFLTLTFLFFTQSFCFAESAWDYSLKLGVRSYPKGASLTGKLGHSTKIWGSGNKTFYGFIRPSIEVKTSGLVNYGRARLDFFPISFLGFYGGYAKGNRNVDEIDTFDCTQVICDESLERSFYGAKFALALGRFFLVGDHKIEEIEVDGRAGVFAEESSSLIGRSGSDVLGQSSAVLGINLSATISVSALYSRSSMKHVRNDSNMALGILRLKSGTFSYSVGVGQFHSRNQTDHFTAIGLIHWKGSKGLLLF